MAANDVVKDKYLNRIDLGEEKDRITEEQIVGAVYSTLSGFAAARQEKEQVWLEAWSHYFGTFAAQEYIRQRVTSTVGDVQSDWRHHVSSGKGFEIVETITSWLVGAFFPSDNWFDVAPRTPLQTPEWKKFLRMMRRYMSAKLDACDFKAQWTNFIRQMVLCGTSCMALPWRTETQIKVKRSPVPNKSGSYTFRKEHREEIHFGGPVLKTLDMFDVYLDPSAENTDNSTLIRRLRLTKGELLRAVDDGLYPLVDARDIREMVPTTDIWHNYSKDRSSFTGIEKEWNPNDVIEVFEYWGDLFVENTEYHNVVVTVAGDRLLAFDNNDYWYGKPFIVGTYIPVVDEAYGVGALEPALAQLHEIDIVANQRLDNGELATDIMWEVVNDGTVDLDSVYTSPGRVIPVAQFGNIRPIPRDTNFNWSLQEEQLLFQKAERTTGTTAFIGSGQGRSGDRVTKAEVESYKEAGGNRLNLVYTWIETTSLIPFLRKLYAYMQQFVVQPDIVRVPGDDSGSWEYLEVGPMQLQIELDIIPRGASHIANREFELKNRLDFVEIVSKLPQFQKLVKWEELLVDLACRFLEDEYERFVIVGEQNPETPEYMTPPPSPTAMNNTEQPQMPPGLMERAAAIGGEPAQKALAGELLAKGPEQAISDMYDNLQGQ